MTTVKAVFLLPIRDNDGRPLGIEIGAAIDEVFEAFGGWTFEGTVSGAFRMADGTQKRDECAKYTVVLDGRRLRALERILRRFKTKTLQEAIYLEILRNVDFRLL